MILRLDAVAICCHIQLTFPTGPAPRRHTRSQGNRFFRGKYANLESVFGKPEGGFRSHHRQGFRVIWRAPAAKWQGPFVPGLDVDGLPKNPRRPVFANDIETGQVLPAETIIDMTIQWLWQGFYHAALMGWETFWALVLGFAVSAALQVFVSKERIGQLFGRTNVKSMALATGFGAASSSCSYAAAAAARSAFAQGAALIPALAFMFASTNLVIELGAVLWLLMGWRFVLAEVIGSFVLITLLWLLARLLFPRGLEPSARDHAKTHAAAGHGCHHCESDGHEAPEEHEDHDHAMHGTADATRWRRMGSAFVMDWQMLWKEIVIGFLIAGYLSVLVPAGWWKVLFLSGGPGWLRLVENAFVGPLIAMASFVCSVGNLPLANLLWSDGISFGGVISFIYADLLIIPLLLIYQKYYGTHSAAYIIAVLFLSTVGAGIIVDLIFSVCGWIPNGPRPASALEHMHFRWNYTTWLDLIALPAGTLLWWLQRGGSAGSSHAKASEEHAAMLRRQP